MLAAEPGGPEEPLLSEEVLGFWTEHSERAALPSGLAALGAAKKSDRDCLDRWSPEGAGARGGTCRAVVAELQGKLAAAPRSDAAFADLGEASAVSDHADWLMLRKGSQERAARDLATETYEDLGVGAGRPQGA